MTGANEPLKDEAAKRGEWRGEDRPPPSGEGSPPASEDGDEGAQESDDRAGPPGVAPPPD